MTFEDFVLSGDSNCHRYAVYAESNGALWHIGQVADCYDSNPDWHNYDIAVNDEDGLITFLVPLSVLDGCDHEE